MIRQWVSYKRMLNRLLFTVAQIRHFIKHLFHDFTKQFLNDFTICSTILQFAPRLYNLLHDFTICSTILQFAPRFYNYAQIRSTSKKSYSDNQEIKL